MCAQCFQSKSISLMSLFLSAGQWWDVQKGEALQTFYPTGTALKRIHVSSDFSTFVTIDNIGILYILQRVVWRHVRCSRRPKRQYISKHCEDAERLQVQTCSCIPWWYFGTDWNQLTTTQRSNMDSFQYCSVVVESTKSPMIPALISALRSEDTTAESTWPLYDKC